MTDADAPDRTISVREILESAGPHFEGTAWVAKYTTPGQDTTLDDVRSAIEDGQLEVVVQEGEFGSWRVTRDSYYDWVNARGLEFTRQLVDRWHRERSKPTDP